MVGVLQALVEGLAGVATPSVLMFVALGVLVGIIIGLLPGLGGAIGVAIMLPFTFDLGTMEAFAFLLALLAVSATAGDLTSILVGVPGEVTSAALVLDGHELSKQGQAGRVLGVSLGSSLIGALFGAIAIVAVVPIVRPLVLSFGSPEFFMLTVVGLAFIGSLSGKTRTKGLIAAALGVGLSTVGLDPQAGIQRYTFGFLFLWDGLGLVAAALGLFGIPELWDLLRRQRGKRDGTGPPVATPALGGVWSGVRESFSYWWLSIRCAFIGTFIGALPGLGGSVSQWVAYGHSKQSRGGGSSDEATIAGVVGPSAASNSKEGGSLIPLLAFGIPGSVTMAVLLGAFLIHGLPPGPRMLTDQIHVTMGFVWILIISNVATFALCMIFLRQLSAVAALSAGVLVPVVSLLIFQGAYTERGSLWSIPVMFGFGALGLIMTKLKWPKPPLILGLVLGGLSEVYLFRTVSRFGWEWLQRPQVLFLVVLTLAVAVRWSHLWRRLRARKDPTGPERATSQRAVDLTGLPGDDSDFVIPERKVSVDEPVAVPAPAVPKGADALFAALLTVVVLLAGWMALDWPFRTRLFPISVAAVTAVLGAPYALATGWRWFRERSTRVSAATDARQEDRRGLRVSGVLVGWLSALFVGVIAFGLPVAGTVGAGLYIRFVGRESVLVSVGVSLGLIAVFAGLGMLIGLSFPGGLLL